MNHCLLVSLALGVSVSIFALHTRTHSESQGSAYRSDLRVAQSAGLAILDYAEKHHGQLPASRHWEESIKSDWPEKDSTVLMARHPGDRLTMNDRFSGLKLRQISPDTSVVLYESHSDTKNAHGIFPWKQYHQCSSSAPGSRMIVFASGWSASYAEGPEIMFTAPKK
ncbi:hypothetical protein [Capsulimonas corticalis]|uniref:hypothetical protein n=1 Tax=Capsulimonas corticalis TaxID=2219043 RepID=UPI000F64D56A|nr:hypothetical protein [Capsulimonas corticalis]